METQLPKINHKQKKNITSGSSILDFKLYYRAIVIQTAWHWHKKRQTDQWDKTEALQTADF